MKNTKSFLRQARGIFFMMIVGVGILFAVGAKAQSLTDCVPPCPGEWKDYSRYVVINGCPYYVDFKVKCCESGAEITIEKVSIPWWAEECGCNASLNNSADIMYAIMKSILHNPLFSSDCVNDTNSNVHFWTYTCYSRGFVNYNGGPSGGGYRQYELTPCNFDCCDHLWAKGVSVPLPPYNLPPCPGNPDPACENVCW